MTFASIDWLSISINLLLVIFVVVCLLMTLLILMQRPKQEGLGAAFGAGVTDQVFGARTTNVLQRGTVWLGSLFFILSLALAILIGQQNKKEQLLKPVVKEEATAKPEAEVPKQEEPAPVSLEEELPAESPAPVVIPEDAPADTPAETTPDPTPVEETPAPAEEIPTGETTSDTVDSEEEKSEQP
jgi:preprotein translocase subunit SecG